MSTSSEHPNGGGNGGGHGFGENFRRLFVRGLVAVLPTLITLWLLVWVWNFLWMNVGQYILMGISKAIALGTKPLPPFKETFYLEAWLKSHGVPEFGLQVIGVVLAVVAIYLVGLIAGGFLGRTFYRLGENLIFRIPLVRAIYPAVKQVTDFLLQEKKKENQFSGSRVIAVKNHSSGIWSIGLYTGSHIAGLPVDDEEMVTVFIPSTPTAFTGYVVVVARKDVVELPLSVEEAMRLLVSGGVVSPSALGNGQTNLQTGGGNEVVKTPN